MIFLGNFSRGTFEEPCTAHRVQRIKIVSFLRLDRDEVEGYRRVYLRFPTTSRCKFLRREFYPRGNVESNYSFYFFFSALVELIEKNWGRGGVELDIYAAEFP